MKSTASFERRLNKDADLRKLERGQYRSARNARVGTSQESNVGTLESAPSNAIFSGSYTFPAGTNKCIGTCADIKNNAIIYCFYNSNGNHRILKWDADTNTITDVLDTDWNVSVLGWTSTSRLWNMRIVESGTDQIMFFHEVQGLPRRINLGIIAQRTTGAYTLTEDDISVARRPPSFAPTWSYNTDTNSPSSFVQNVFFQFQYRYVYENGEISTWSPLSTLTIPPQDGVSYNKIVVTFNSGVKGVTKVQIARRIGNGSSDTGTVNPTLYIFNTWIKGSNSDSTNYTVDFFNTEVLKPVSQVQSNKLFDQVPQLVGCQEVVQSNQVIYGDITEGYDNITNANVVINQTFENTGIKKYITTDDAGNYKIEIIPGFLPAVGDYIYVQIDDKVMSLVVTTSSASPVASQIATLINQINAYTASESGGIVTTNVPTTSVTLLVYSINFDYESVYTDSQYSKTNTAQSISGGYIEIEYNDVTINGFDKISLSKFKVNPQLYPIKYDFNIEASFAGGAGIADVNIVLLDVDANAPIFFQTISVAIGDYTQAVSFTIEANCIQGKTLAIVYEKISGATRLTGNGNTLNVTATKKSYLKKGFKSGATHRYGIVYYDKYLRQSGVQALTSSYIKFPTQRDYRLPYTTENDSDGYIGQLNWEIKHLPPSWAYYYSWVYDGSNVQKYAQFISLMSPSGVSSGYVTIDISNISLYGYMYSAFSEGDRVRLVGYPNVISGTEPTRHASTLIVDESIYREGIIVGVSSTEIIVSINQEIQVNYTFLDVLVEAYSVTKSEIYFEQTMYEIGNPTANNRYHKGPNQNQDPSNPTTTPAKGDFVGNAYFTFISQYFNENQEGQVVSFVESDSVSLVSESNYWNKGRPQIETPDQKQMRIPWMYRWGNQLLQDTQVNGMSTFDSGNYGLLSAKFGSFVAMREVGYTLKMIQEANYNTAFIQRRQIQNADGSTQLVVTDSLIGSVNPSEDLYGTKYPGSVCVNGRNVYWLDTIKGKVIRESGNSPFPISDYGMVKYWRDAALTIDSLGYEVFTGFDKQTEQLFITYKRTGADVFTLSFYDPERDGIEKGWVCDQHDFTKVISSVVTPIDMYGWVGQIFTSALAGGLYKHNVGSSYLQLYGEQKTMSVSSAFVLDPEQMTVFLAHWVRANKAFAGTIFTIPAGPQTPNGMRTLLVPGNYVTRENVFYSEIKRDGYTKGVYADNSNSFITQMLEGRVMRGHVCLAEISYASSTIFILYSHAIADEYSPLS